MSPNPNYQKMMKQVQKMQADMAKMQEDLASEVVEASAGGGMVTVQVTSAIELKSIKIDPAAIDPDDVEMLEDMILAAVQDAMTNAEELSANKMAELTGGQYFRAHSSEALREIGATLDRLQPVAQQDLPLRRTEELYAWPLAAALLLALLLAVRVIRPLGSAPYWLRRSRR